MSKQDIEWVRIQVADHAESIKTLFGQTQETRVLILIQNNTGDGFRESDADVLVTDIEDMKWAIESIQKLSGMTEATRSER